MKTLTIFLAAAFCLLLPSPGKAQNTGRVECAREDDYVYLYSSMTTLSVRATVQCNDIVQITGRYEVYFAVRTSKGDSGYIPLANITVLKDQPGQVLPQPATPPAPRERTPYDGRLRAGPADPKPTAPAFTLVKGTSIRVKILKTISSASTHVGEVLEFEVLEDVSLEGIVVVNKGAKATGVVAESEPKKHFGRSGKLRFNITSVSLSDNEQVPVRCFQEVYGTPATSSEAVVPLGSGKEAAVPQDTEFSALVDADVHLKRSAFITAKITSTPAHAAPEQTLRPPN